MISVDCFVGKCIYSAVSALVSSPEIQRSGLKSADSEREFLASFNLNRLWLYSFCSLMTISFSACEFSHQFF